MFWMEQKVEGGNVPGTTHGWKTTGSQAHTLVLADIMETGGLTGDREKVARSRGKGLPAHFEPLGFTGTTSILKDSSFTQTRHQLTIQ